MSKGFTIIELVVSSIIFVFISLFSFMVIQQGGKSKILESAQSQIINDLKEMSNYALVGKIHSEGNPPAGGYGFHVNKCLTPICRYTLFADLNGDYKLDSKDAVLEEKVVSNAILIYNFKSNGLTDPGPIDIVFLPYLGSAVISGNLLTPPPVNSNSNSNANSNSNTPLLSGKIDDEKIIIKDNSSLKTATIGINASSGLIYRE